MLNLEPIAPKTKKNRVIAMSMWQIWLFAVHLHTDPRRHGDSRIRIRFSYSHHMFNSVKIKYMYTIHNDAGFFCCIYSMYGRSGQVCEWTLMRSSSSPSTPMLVAAVLQVTVPIEFGDAVAIAHVAQMAETLLKIGVFTLEAFESGDKTN